MLNLSRILRALKPSRGSITRRDQGRYRPGFDCLEDRSLMSTPPLTPAIALQPVLTGLNGALHVTNAGDGSNRLFIAEQRGVIRVMQPGASTTTVFLNLSNTTVDGVPGLNLVRAPAVPGGSEQGLLGLAFHPDYEVNGRFFLHYTTLEDGSGSMPVNQIVEYQVDPTNPNEALTTETMILRFPAQPFGNHNGGSIEFGNDGYLYSSKGDGGSGGDPGNRAQDRRDTIAGVNNENSWFGKVHRIDINGPDQFPEDPFRNYAIPASNPFVGLMVSGPLGTEPLEPAREEIYAYGVRNPYRFSFDRPTGQLWLGDVGQGQREEINIIVQGGNYGWRAFEGTRVQTGADPLVANPGATIFPITEYGVETVPGGSRSVTGGQVYRGTQSALPEGAYLFGDFVTGQLMVYTNGWRFSLQTLQLPSSFGVDEDGEIYITSFNGTMQRVVNPNLGVRILDSGGADFATTASFLPFPAQGFGNDVHYAPAGAGKEAADWTFTGLTPGRYRVSATWSPHPNRATDSPFTVYDGPAGNGPSLGTFPIDQETAPGTFVEKGIRWQDLSTGSFVITGTTLSVRLTDAANEFVIADAVRVERMGDADDPEIVVQQGEFDLADNTGVAIFDGAPVGGALAKTFFVFNMGGADLTLSDLTATGGFSILSGFVSTKLAPGDATTFQIQIDTAKAGLFNGTVSFTTNDADEDPFDFTVVGAVGGATFTQIIDNDDPGYADSGFTPFAGQGFANGVAFADAGTGFREALPATPAGNAPAFATWTFSGLTPGLYRVSATWSSDANRATNAPFVIRDGSTILDQVRINQELDPDDYSADGGVWKNLGGPYLISSGTIEVLLTNAANEYVIADAIRIERLPFDPTWIIDDGDGFPSFVATPGFVPFESQGFKNNVSYANPGTGSETATFTFDGLVDDATYKVSITWTPHPNRATNAPFTVNGGSPIFVNQEQSPEDFRAAGASWQILGNFAAASGQIEVQLTDFADEYVIADAVLIERLT
jgi:glucose/arabinose dehydrogenase